MADQDVLDISSEETMGRIIEGLKDPSVTNDMMWDDLVGLIGRIAVDRLVELPDTITIKGDKGGHVLVISPKTVRQLEIMLKLGETHSTMPVNHNDVISRKIAIEEIFRTNVTIDSINHVLLLWLEAVYLPYDTEYPTEVLIPKDKEHNYIVKYPSPHVYNYVGVQGRSKAPDYIPTVDWGGRVVDDVLLRHVHYSASIMSHNQVPDLPKYIIVRNYDRAMNGFDQLLLPNTDEELFIYNSLNFIPSVHIETLKDEYSRTGLASEIFLREYDQAGKVTEILGRFIDLFTQEGDRSSEKQYPRTLNLPSAKFKPVAVEINGPGKVKVKAIVEEKKDLADIITKRFKEEAAKAHYTLNTDVDWLDSYLEVAHKGKALDKLPDFLKASDGVNAVYLIIPQTEEEYLTWLESPSLQGVIASYYQEQNRHNLLSYVVVADYNRRGKLTMEMMNVANVFLCDKDIPYPKITAAIYNGMRLDISFIDSSYIEMGEEEFNLNYVNFKGKEETEPTEPYNRETLDERFEPSSTDQLFEEVGQGLKEAIETVKVPPLAETLAMGTSENGKYLIQFTREFETREEALEAMRTIMEI